MNPCRTSSKLRVRRLGRSVGTLLILTAVLVRVDEVTAQQQYYADSPSRVAYGAPGCAEPARPPYPPPTQPCNCPTQPCNCPPQHVVVRLPPCEEGAGIETGPGGPEAGPGGVFAAPPQTGAAVEGASRIGIRGFALRLPEVRLELPTLELPSIVRSRRGPHMEIDRAVAPYVQLPAAAGFGQTVSAARQMIVRRRGEGAPEAAERPEEGAQPEAAEEEFRKRCEQLDALHADLKHKQQCLDQKLMQVDNLLQELQRSRCQPPGRAEVIPPTPPPRHESLPMPMDSSAIQYPVEATSHSAAEPPPSTPSIDFLPAFRDLPPWGRESQ